jgi:hypothetical protein
MKITPQRFTWEIQITVDRVWVADGFDPDARQFQEALLTAMLGYATHEEMTVRVLARPADSHIAAAQGYESVAKYRKDNWVSKTDRRA